MNAEQPGLVRASHADRDAVVERLREAAGEGRLDLDELETRVEAALTAKTVGELAPLTADLPPLVPPADAEPLVLRGGMAGLTRVGDWSPPARITAHGGMGGVKLDFTRTRPAFTEFVLEVHGGMAGVTIVIPDGWTANTNGVDPGVGGVKDKTTPEREPGAPLVRLTGSGGAAGVTVRHPGRRERRKLRDSPPPRKP